MRELDTDNHSDVTHVREGWNWGWALLRVLLCFLVILEHFWVHEVPLQKAWQVPFDMLAGISVPAFMFISFYLAERHLTHPDRGYLVRRLRRIGWPILGWAIIYFAVLWFAADWLGLQRPEAVDVVWQSVTGHSPTLNPSMWYQAVLVVLTVLLLCIVRLAPRRALWSLTLLMAAALMMIWSGLNETLFGALRYELKYPLGRVAEMMPFAVLGYAASRLEIFERTRRHRGWLFALFLLLTVASVALLQGHKNEGFGYSALFYLPSAICLVLACRYAPLGEPGPRIKKVLTLVCSFTLGIYCLHRLTFPVMKRLTEIAGLDTGYFHVCVLTYLVSFGLCWLISRLPWKWARGLVE